MKKIVKRICYFCKIEKSGDEFKKFIGTQPMCHYCHNEKKEKAKIRENRRCKRILNEKGYFLENENEYSKLYSKMKRIEKKYKLKYTEYLEMVDRCNGYCEICKIKFFRVIDHCHKTGKVRGLLCDRCNYGIGIFQDNSENLRNAAEYVDNPPHY